MSDLYPNKQSVQGQRVLSESEIFSSEAGDWFIPDRADPDAIWLMVPGVDDGYNDSKTLVRLPLRGDKAWGWNDDRDKPTLIPSIGVRGHWHGWLRDGKLVSA